MKWPTIVFSGLLLVGACHAQNAIDKVVGTWKPQPERFSPPDENLASGTEWITKVGPNTVRQKTELVDKSGAKRTSDTTETCDGKEHHTEGAPEGSTWICQPETWDFVSRRDGKVVMEVKTIFSDDGRTMTFHRRRFDRTGKWVEDTRVWLKQ